MVQNTCKLICLIKFTNKLNIDLIKPEINKLVEI